MSQLNILTTQGAKYYVLNTYYVYMYICVCVEGIAWLPLRGVFAVYTKIYLCASARVYEILRETILSVVIKSI